MTLDEAIEVEEAETLAHEQTLNSLDDNMPNDMREVFEKSIGKNMEYHRQLAEWLRELKAFNENDDVKDVFKNCDTCKYQSLEADDFPCDRCCHRYINQYVYDDKREVNVDADCD